MYSFNNDYTELAHERLLNKLIECNMEYDRPYGFDSHGEIAQDLIRKKINNENVDVHFISGGTQTNIVAIASALYNFESVISTDIAHINVFETGAIEISGHKIYTFPHINGKLDLEAVKEYYNKTEGLEFFAVPKMICITNATEYGTYYTKAELEEIYAFCKEKDIYLFIDGARMASALSAKGNDVKYTDLPNLCDIFYFGGTKNGAMLGEALVLVNDKLKANYKAKIKQRGALMAKGKVMSLQFEELFKDGLYEQLATHANEMSDKLREKIKDCNYDIYLESTTNQTFAIMPNKIIDKLKDKYIFSIDSKIDEGNSIVRFVTSWATKEEEVEKFGSYLKSISGKYTEIWVYKNAEVLDEEK